MKRLSEENPIDKMNEGDVVASHIIDTNKSSSSSVDTVEKGGTETAEGSASGETASTVYTPSPAVTMDRVVYGDPGAPQKKAPRAGIALVAILLALSLILGFLGGAGGMMLVMLRSSEREGGSVLEGEGEAETDNNTSGTATIYKQNVTVNLVDVPATGEEMTIAQVYSKVSSSVVAITTSVKMTSSFYGGFYLTTGSGSGVILSEEGYIVTNYHVVKDATEITVTLQNGNEYPAVYLDGDRARDIALLKIEATEILSPATVGSSGRLVVGQEVVAVGNPLGILPGTLTDGIISALDRTVEIDGYSRTLIQTNTAINPGNSGGGLFDRYGNLVGIVNAKESSEGVEGLGFAIPIDSVFANLMEIIEDGYIHGRAHLDLEMREISDVKEAYSLYRNQMSGIYIQSAAHKEGLNVEAGDRLCAVNGVEIRTESDLDSVLSGLTPGDSVTITIGRVTVVSSGFWASYTEQYYDVVLTLEEYVPTHAITFE